MRKNESFREAPTEMIGRQSDVARILGWMSEAECCSVVGVSNVGKSSLLRALSLGGLRKQHPDSTAGSIFVYVDLNLALQMTEQGFYEATLRNLLSALRNQSGSDRLIPVVQEAYQTVVAPTTPFLIPLAFENCLEALYGLQTGKVVFLLDEFDEAFGDIEPHLFVRLRALKDKHGTRLCYVTATDRALSEIRHERRAGEFCELFEGHTHHLTPLIEQDARALVSHWANQSKTKFSSADLGFVVERAGGHPGLLQAVCRVLARSKDEALLRPGTTGYAHVQERLDSDSAVRLECAKLWSDLSPKDQDTLISLPSDGGTATDLNALLEKGIVLHASSGPRVFAQQFADFVNRQRLVRHAEPPGVRIDVEAGDVRVDGKLAPALTDLEYKLLLLLYGNLGKICDKYRVVESVWGENYIDEVDDARIEKLVSRLREKIEPIPEQPRYVVTVRGRGYKLVSPD